MSDPANYAACLAASEHLRTLVGLLQQDGIDVIVGSGETEHGVPFSFTLTQGRFHRQAAMAGEGFAIQVRLDREAERRLAEEN